MLMVLRAKTTLNYKKYKGKNTLRMCLSSAVCCAIPSAFPLSRLLEYCWGWHHAALRENSLLGPWHRTEISARRHKNLGMLRGWERGVSPRTVLGSRHLVRALWVRWEENRVLGPAGLFRVCISLCALPMLVLGCCRALTHMTTCVSLLGPAQLLVSVGTCGCSGTQLRRRPQGTPLSAPHAGAVDRWFSCLRNQSQAFCRHMGYPREPLLASSHLR